ncbi:MAG TPA: PilZ domain-containing protein [Blastocatellia bacterium]|nr:PilZ domain-containing protein [Blastocatellia bacterium]
MIERRQWPRYQIDCPFEVQGTDPSGRKFAHGGRLLNISARGALGNIGQGVQVGAQVEVFIRVRLADSVTLKFIGEVIRVQYASTGVDVAVQFLTSRPTILAAGYKS